MQLKSDGLSTTVFPIQLQYFLFVRVPPFRSMSPVNFADLSLFFSCFTVRLCSARVPVLGLL
jgi:hypothetical protein